MENKIKNSAYVAEVVDIKLNKHPDADKLSIVNIEGWTVVVNTEQWLSLPLNAKGELLGVYIKPDTIVDITRPEFNFLAEARIRVKKLRGVKSFGLLIPAPIGSNLGDDLWEALNLEHYQPEIHRVNNKKEFFSSGEAESAPDLVSYKYDLENLKSFGKKLFTNLDKVYLTEKLDGTNSRFVYYNGKMYCGSRTEWKKQFPSFSHVTKESLIANGCPENKVETILESLLSKTRKKNHWWTVLEQYPEIEKFCQDNPGTVIYGESYGQTNLIKYPFSDRVKNKFAAFDLLKDGKWLDWNEAREMLRSYHVPIVPHLSESLVEYDFDKILEEAEKPSVVEGLEIETIKEGIVVRTPKEEMNEKGFRKILKVHSFNFQSLKG